MPLDHSLEIVRHGHNYCVHENGEVVYGPTAYDMAEEALERRKAKLKTKPRKCMTCPKIFESEGPHHRMCERCRQKSYYDGSA